jgi:uncharacterized protein (DUF2062 family)
MSEVPRSSWWARRIVQPIMQQMTQGVTVEKITLTIALGVTLGLFPILGATSILSGVAAWGAKLNQPIIQAVTLLAYPAQCLVLVPFYRAGEWLFGIPPIPLSVGLIIERFMAGLGPFLRDYGMTGVRGIVVWVVVAPVLFAVVYFIIRPLVRRLAPA